MNETFGDLEDLKKLHDWFLINQRDFPWRRDRTPYRVWVSEVMLQQTRASVVIPYFLKWMELFPDVQRLAEAPLEKVIKVWEGLGYYSRARRLHEGAQAICDRFGGHIPSSKEELSSIPGLGPYTVGAILSFGFNQRSAAIDGNVMRVLSRYFLIEQNICKAAGKRLLELRGENFLDQEKPWVTAEALIELGATICSAKPHCEQCPLSGNCLGLKSGKAELLPLKDGPVQIVDLARMVAIVECEGSVLIKKEEKGKVMAGLYQFPYFEMEDEIWGSNELVKALKKSFGLKVSFVRSLMFVQHSFTRYKAKIYPLHVSSSEKKNVDDFEWMPIERLDELPFSSGHKKIVQNLLSLRGK